tara:strand:+ start:1634 stop:2203 length:570 start_codon:yes stop_codon:yes gene_type:complete
VSSNSNPIVFVICGAGGAGKGTIVGQLMKDDATLHLSQSWTTRQRRPNEAEDAYAYVTDKQFDERIAVDGFYEWANFFEYRYGTPTPMVPVGKDLLLEIDVQGAVAVRERQPDAVVILIVPPNRLEQESRMRARGDGEEHIKQRLSAAEMEEKIGRELADSVVLNGELDAAVSEVRSFIADVRQRRFSR